MSTSNSSFKSNDDFMVGYNALKMKVKPYQGQLEGFVGEYTQAELHYSNQLKGIKADKVNSGQIYYKLPPDQEARVLDAKEKLKTFKEKKGRMQNIVDILNEKNLESDDVNESSI